MPDILKDLNQQLSNWDTQYQSAEGAGQLPHLLIQVGAVTGTLAQISTAQKIAGADPMRDGVDILQMYFQLPFEMNPQYYDETSMLLSDINARSPVLGFIANAKDRKVAFRYMHLVNPDDPNIKLIDEALSNIDIVLDLFQDAIQAVATGEKSYDVAIQTLP